jgi:predicted kinase
MASMRWGESDRSTLVLITGLPAAGKSTLAEAVGRRAGVPVFALDWLLGAVVQSGACAPDADLGELGRQLLVMLAHRQFLLGQSAIIDAPGHEPAWRDPFLGLAATDEVQVRIVEVLCPDESVHRARVAGRVRGIPGWHEFNWSHVERMKLVWQPWPAGTDRLVVDSTRDLDEELDRVMGYLRFS